MNYESKSLGELLSAIDEMGGVDLEEVPGSVELFQEMKEEYERFLNIREQSMKYLSSCLRCSYRFMHGEHSLTRNSVTLRYLREHDKFLSDLGYKDITTQSLWCVLATRYM